MEHLLDVNTLRSLTTVVSFAVFLAILAWTFSRKNRQGFDDAAALPFLDEQAAQTPSGGSHE
ncbi:MAG: hypothetical protein RJA44_2636 [Pseudomonadota bacterium]|jgi:cytochrome c oxidase cbb3-type subunit 4